ncbi:MAG: hypothetical protein N2510_09295 [Ignavibacteria bacterium]|nr:hypothetical protein [Ignavibacteria bacterium]
MRKFLIFSALCFFLISCSEEEPEFVDDKPSVKIEKKPDTTKKTNSTEKTSETKNPFRDEKPVAVISPVEAGQYNGKVVTVKGFVADVYKSEKVAYLNFTEKYPKNPFSAVIFASRFSSFENIEDYKLKDVEVTGRVSFYRGKPQIIVDSPEQIVIR